MGSLPRKRLDDEDRPSVPPTAAVHRTMSMMHTRLAILAGEDVSPRERRVRREAIIADARGVVRDLMPSAWPLSVSDEPL